MAVRCGGTTLTVFVHKEVHLHAVCIGSAIRRRISTTVPPVLAVTVFMSRNGRLTLTAGTRVVPQFCGRVVHRLATRAIILVKIPAVLVVAVLAGPGKVTMACIVAKPFAHVVAVPVIAVVTLLGRTPQCIVTGRIRVKVIDLALSSLAIMVLTYSVLTAGIRRPFTTDTPCSCTVIHTCQ